MEYAQNIAKNSRSEPAKKHTQIPTSANSPTFQRVENNTGLPDNLKAGIENLSGHSMDDVNVHYNSSKPAGLQAHAYAQGTDIHLAPGQERHLPHEAWHVVQQKQGRVKPTMQLKGKMNVNDDAGLEHEADVMGKKAKDNHDNGDFFNRGPVQRIDNGSSTIQRVVTVINESNPATLWENVKGLVDRAYGRKKTLLEWSKRPNDYLNFDSYELLARSLDLANKPKTKEGRSRPDWTPKIKDYYDKTWGGKRHRRHIIMSSLMRDAVYAVSDNEENDQALTLKIYNEIIATAGFAGYDASNISQAEAALVYVLHNNPANLVLDSGPENSAIGSVAHTFDGLLQKDAEGLKAEFTSFEADSNTYLNNLVRGFQPEVQKKIMNMLKQFPKPKTPLKFRDFLETIYDNTAFDLMTNQKLPPHAAEMYDLHGRFVASRSSGDLQIFYGTAMSYVLVGTRFKACPYSSIW